MKHLKRITAAVLSVLLVSSMTVPACAETASSAKEEVIYVMTDAAGQVTDLEVVNIFEGGEITDYGDYSSVKILNTTDEIAQTGDVITFSSDADRVYYQGTMETTVIPWNISIRYCLNGTEYSPSELAGKSGALEIVFTVSKNEACTGSFYEDYALQATFTLDTNRCKNIFYDGATAANVGADKQLTYTILPGKGIQTVIEADVTEFEMDAVSINGVQLNMELNLSVDASEFSFDLSEYTGKLTDLQSGTAELDDGAAEIYAGAQTLETGMSDLLDHVTEFRRQLEQLSSNSDAINTGAAALADQVFAGATTQLQTALIAAGMTKEEATAVTLTRSNFVETLARLANGTPSNGQVSMAVEQIRSILSENGVADAAVQDVAMTLADGFVSDGSAATVSDALTKAGDALSAAASVQRTVATVGATQAVRDLVLVLMGEPYHLDAQSAAMVAAMAVSLDSENPQTQLATASAMVQSALKVSCTPADEDSIWHLGSRAASEGIVAQTGQFSDMKTQLDQVVLFLNSLKSYTDGVDTSTTKMSELETAIGNAYDGTSYLSGSIGSLKEGTTALKENTSELDADEMEENALSEAQNAIDQKIADLQTEMFSSDDKVTSFVSVKNTAVTSVQFVIKTAAIKEAEAVETALPQQEPLSFWQKLLRLFGIG